MTPPRSVEWEWWNGILEWWTTGILEQWNTGMMTDTGVAQLLDVAKPFS